MEQDAKTIVELKPNSKGSLYNAHKLSCIGIEREVVNNGVEDIFFGCEDDDEFYDEGEGRLKLYIEKEIFPKDTDGFDSAFLMLELDLEQLILKAKELCPHLF